MLFILGLNILGQDIQAQISYRLNGAHEDIGTSLSHQLENGNYWVFETLPTGAPLTSENLLRITEFDECGALRSFSYTHPPGYGISYLYNTITEGDTLILCMKYSANDFNSHSEIGFLSINMTDLGHKYHYFRADNNLYSLGFFKTEDDHYFLHTFLSYTDRPIQFGSFLLNRNFEVEKYYEKFGWGTITGTALETEGGYFIATSRKICKLDYNMNPIWIKSLGEHQYIRQAYNTDQGIVFRVIKYIYEPGLRLEFNVVKIDLDGNLVWQSDDLNYDLERNGAFRMIKNKDGNFEIAISKQFNKSNFNNEMVLNTIDQEDGRIIKSENSFNTTLVDSFQLKNFTGLSNGVRQLLIEDQDHKTVVWNVSNYTQCNLEEGARSLEPSAFIMEDTPLLESIEDEVYTGSYLWQLIEGSPDIENICTDYYPLRDLLPQDTIVCKEIGIQVDLTEIPYQILWDDGNTEKLRSLQESGNYTYRVDHCDILFEETINLSLESCDCNFYIPNAFSPNGDGLNEVFEVINKCKALEIFNLSIYDRWGNQIYRSQDQTEAWNGQFKGQDLDTGIYTYLLVYKSKISPGEIKKSGSISLIK